MRGSLLAAAFIWLLGGASRPADIAFRVTMLDPGYGETVAVTDINHDGKLDIVSGESWYEAPRWTKHPLRQIEYTNGYIDNFSDLAMDVDGDGWTDVLQFSYFAHNIVWLRNPGKTGGAWKPAEIDSSGPTEFAFLVDLNNDGNANEVLPEFDRPSVPLAWFELKQGSWIKHVVAPQSYGHGIGVGDVNGDGRNDILTPKGWLEAPPDVHAAGNWTFHSTDWGWKHIGPAGSPDVDSSRPAQFGFMYLLDINGDGRNDMLTTMAHDYGLAWYEQTANGTWVQHVIDSSWSQAHASQLIDMNGDGQPDLVTGKRYFAHNGSDPGEREPVGLYWYEWRKVPATAPTPRGPGNGGVEWVRHIVDYGGRMGGGVQTVAIDLDGDGDIDLVSANKSGLFIAENLSRSPSRSR